MNKKTTRRLMWLALVAVVLGAFVWVFIPVWTIQPFKAQTSEGVDLSYTLRHWSPVVTVGALVLAALLVVVLGEDKKSVRAFETNVDGRELEFFVSADTGAWHMFDSETRSEWDFTGRATAGALAGRQLKKIPLLKDYWFDWKIYNPQTSICTLGVR